jgi:hypothetical protein
MLSVMRYTLVMDVGSISRSWTFFCVMNAADDAPRTATAVLPVDVAAFTAYSDGVGRPRRIQKKSEATSLQQH